MFALRVESSETKDLRAGATTQGFEVTAHTQYHRDAVMQPELCFVHSSSTPRSSLIRRAS